MRSRRPIRRPGRTRGFTLVEAVMVIVVTGILAGTSSAFLAGPVKSYFDTVRRGQLADAADTALRRVAREVEGALPNSIRVTTVGTATYLELIPALGAGHYRSAADPSSATPVMDFTSLAGSSFEVLGPADTPTPGTQAVIFNLGPGVAASDAYGGSNRRSIVSLAANILTYTLGGSQFPFASPSDRYYLVNGATTYVCSPAGGSFSRYSGYAIQAAQPLTTAAAPLNAATRGLLATAVSACSISYSQTLQSRGLVALTLTVSSQGESVTLYQEVHVPNVP